MSFYTRSHKDRWFGRKIGETTTVSIGAASATSVQLATGFYRAIGTVACHVRVDLSAAATTNHAYVPANTEIFFMVDRQFDTNVAGQTWRAPGFDAANAYLPAGAEAEKGFVSVIRAGASNGTLYITKISDLGDLNADV